MIYMRVCGIRAAIRHAMIASGLTAATLTAGALPADAATTGWRFFARVPAPAGSHGVLFAVHADAPGDAWGVGAYNPSAARVLIDRWNGIKWAQVALPSSVRSALGRQQLFLTVGSSSAANVWAFGFCASRLLSGACWLHRSGSTWTGGRLVGRRVSNVPIEHLLLLGRREGWAVCAETPPHRPRALALH